MRRRQSRKQSWPATCEKKPVSEVCNAPQSTSLFYDVEREPGAVFSTRRAAAQMLEAKISRLEARRIEPR